MPPIEVEMKGEGTTSHTEKNLQDRLQYLEAKQAQSPEEVREIYYLRALQQKAYNRR
jgi:hypothetical protein